MSVQRDYGAGCAPIKPSPVSIRAYRFALTRAALDATAEAILVAQ
jgi:hypothetical protein